MTQMVTVAAAAQLIELAAEEEQRFAAGLSEAERADRGSAERWSAGASLAHVTEWKAVQVERLRAYLEGRPAPDCDGLPFPHREPAAYAPLAAVAWEGLPATAARVSAELATLTRRLDDRDLKRRFDWTLGKPLAQQLLGRGVWHTLTHLAEYARERGRDGEVQRLQGTFGERIVALSAWPVPDDPMGHYNVACLCVAAGELDRARALLEAAVALDPGLAETARTDADLAAIAA